MKYIEMTANGYVGINNDFKLNFYTYENKFISFCERLKVPKEYEKLGYFVLNHFDNLIDYVGLDPFDKFILYEKKARLEPIEWLQDKN